MSIASYQVVGLCYVLNNLSGLGFRLVELKRNCEREILSISFTDSQLPSIQALNSIINWYHSYWIATLPHCSTQSPKASGLQSSKATGSTIVGCKAKIIILIFFDLNFESWINHLWRSSVFFSVSTGPERSPGRGKLPKWLQSASQTGCWCSWSAHYCSQPVIMMVMMIMVMIIMMIIKVIMMFV